MTDDCEFTKGIQFSLLLTLSELSGSLLHCRRYSESKEEVSGAKVAQAEE